MHELYKHKPLIIIPFIYIYKQIVEDPFMFGRIAAANALSDLYAMGVTHINAVLMVLGVCIKMTE